MPYLVHATISPVYFIEFYLYIREITEEMYFPAVFVLIFRCK